MSTEKNSKAIKSAAADVAKMLTLITNGPRFSNHLADIGSKHGLSGAKTLSEVLRKALRGVLGYN